MKKINKPMLIFSLILIAILTVVFVIDDATVVGQFLDFIEYPFIAVVGAICGRFILRRN